MPNWKGMLKKGTELAKQGTELAKQAKSELEERGVIGGERPQERGTEGAPARTGLSPADQAREITGPDRPHPFQLLTTAEVASALGVDAASVDAPTAAMSDGAAGPSWRVHTNEGDVTVELMLYVDEMDVDEMTSYGDDGQRLAGIGDKAAVSGDMLAVARGGETITIMLTDAPSWQLRPALEVLGRAAAARLPDFHEYAVRRSAPGGPVLTDVLPTDAVSSLLGVTLDVPTIERRDNQIIVTWSEPPAPLSPALTADTDEVPQVRVEAIHYLVDPWEQQRQMADGGSVFAKVAVEVGEAMKEQFAEQYTPVTGPWEEGYLGPSMAYFKKGNRSFQIQVEGIERDTSPEVEALARRLAEGV